MSKVFSSHHFGSLAKESMSKCFKVTSVKSVLKSSLWKSCKRDLHPPRRRLHKQSVGRLRKQRHGRAECCQLNYMNLLSVYYCYSYHAFHAYALIYKHCSKTPKKLGHGCRMIYACLPCFFALFVLGFKDGSCSQLSGCCI